MFTSISIQQAKVLLEDHNAQCLDIRDVASYQQGHIPQAHLIDNSNIAQWIKSASKETPVIVYCYHGNSSQPAAQYLYEQGFTEAYSMDGGFEAWRVSFSEAIAHD